MRESRRPLARAYTQEKEKKREKVGGSVVVADEWLVYPAYGTERSTGARELRAPPLITPPLSSAPLPPSCPASYKLAERNPKQARLIPTLYSHAASTELSCPPFSLSLMLYIYIYTDALVPYYRTTANVLPEFRQIFRLGCCYLIGTVVDSFTSAPLFTCRYRSIISLGIYRDFFFSYKKPLHIYIISRNLNASAIYTAREINRRSKIYLETHRAI